MTVKNSSLILLSADNQVLYNNFRRTVSHPVKISSLPRHDIPSTILQKKAVALWGLNPTSENEKIWSNLKSGDIVLFFRKGSFFSQAKVVAIAQSVVIPPLLWKDERLGKHMNLLIFLEQIKNVEFELNSTKRFFVEPMMPQVYSFPIKKIDDSRVNALISAFGSIQKGITFLSKLKSPVDQVDLEIKSSNLPQNVKLEIISGLAKIRKGQEEFRKKVLLNYGNKCAVCDVNNADLLEASHIIPVEDRKIAGSITNGICLCVIHHTMFDKGYFSLDNKFQIIVSKQKQIPFSLRHFMKEGKKMRLPRISPSQVFLATHRTRFLF